MVASGAWSSLLELEAVSQRVERVEPEHALYLVIRARRLVPRQSYRSFNDIEVLHDERWVCLAGGAKIRFDAKVKNGSTSSEPASPTCCECCGLGNSIIPSNPGGALWEQLVEAVSDPGRGELNDRVLGQPEVPEWVEGKPTVQVLSGRANREDQPAHPWHLTTRGDEHPVGILLVQPSYVFRQCGVDLGEVGQVFQGHYEHDRIVRASTAMTCTPGLTWLHLTAMSALRPDPVWGRAARDDATKGRLTPGTGAPRPT